MAREVTEFVTPTSTDDLPEGSTNKYDTGAPPTDLADLDSTASTKLGGIAENATVDQTAAEMQTALLGQADADQGIMAVSASTGEKKVYSVHINASGNLEADNEDTAES